MHNQGGVLILGVCAYLDVFCDTSLDTTLLSSSSSFIGIETGTSIFSGFFLCLSGILVSVKGADGTCKFAF